MAKYRMVYTEFWTDPNVIEEMTAEDKYFFLYLLTNPNTTQIGIYQITKRQIAFDTGYSLESINSLLERFITHHKIIKYNSETKELAIKNWGKYNLRRGGKPMIDCVKSELSEVKDISLIEYVGKQIENSSIKALYDTYHDTSDDTPTISGQKEKEKEKEKENNNPPKSPLKGKVKFAEFVSMTNAEYEKLVSTHGEQFTQRCIEVLDNYKGAKGRTYKSDYRAILSWVVDRVTEEQRRMPNEKHRRSDKGDSFDLDSLSL